MCRGIVENVLSGTEAGFKATRNLVFNQKAERSTMNRQKSREIVENVLSGTKVCFKTALTIIFNNLNRRQIMPINKNKISKMQSLLLTFTLMVAALWVSPAVAAEKETVFDPATGKTWTAPEYGGTLTWAAVAYPENSDVWWVGGWAPHFISGVNEQLAYADWAISRDIWRGMSETPEMMRGALAESWSMPDDTTFIWNIRQGVYWDNKAPVNGREFDAYDVEWNYHRYLGMGDFTEDGPSPKLGEVTAGLEIESVTATDKWTVVVKLTKPNLLALQNMLINYLFAYPREVVEKYGDYKDWRNAVGTGPWRLTDLVKGSSVTWEKNPNYWGYDEKFPKNRLPYIDEYRSLLMPEMSTRLAALRTGKIDLMTDAGDAYISSIDDLEALQRTNPEIEVWPNSQYPIGPFLFNWALPPTDDANVRKALQMAVDRETIAATYFKGWGDPTPGGIMGQASVGYAWPYEDWPEDVKMGYMYDPAGAEALLDAAGYTRGADGYRFKVKLASITKWDPTYPEIIMGYFEAIGVDSELVINNQPEAVAEMKTDHDWHLVGGGYMVPGFAATWMLGMVTESFGGLSYTKAKDPRIDALYLAATETLDIEEYKSIIRQADELCVREHCGLVKSIVPRFYVNHPWVKGYFGESNLGRGQRNTFMVRLWIDSELKKAMRR